MPKKVSEPTYDLKLSRVDLELIKLALSDIIDGRIDLGNYRFVPQASARARRIIADIRAATK